MRFMALTIPQVTERIRLHQRTGFAVPQEMNKVLIKEINRLTTDQDILESEAIEIVSELERKDIHKRLTKQYLEGLIIPFESTESYQQIKRNNK